MKNRSSCDQLLTCIHEWLTGVFKGSCVNVVYTDIAKAFDTVSHSKLLHILNGFGINSDLISWFKNFLENRQQCVCIGTAVSSFLSVFSGVPQGSVIGPLLFLLYINGVISMVDSLRNVRGISLFADDAKLFDIDANTLQSSIRRFVSWNEDQQLNIASHKCYSIQFAKSNHGPPPSFYIHNEEVQYTPLIRDLGVYISDDLKWQSHIEKIVKKASLTSYQILKCCKSRNIWTLKKLLTTYIRPQLEYNTSVWSPYLQRDIKRVESVQKLYTRSIFLRCAIPFSSYKDRLDKINLESLERRRLNYDLILLYKMINGLSYLNFYEYFQLSNYQYNLRRNSLQIKPLHNINTTNNIWTKNFFNRIPIHWNKLPNDVVTSPTLSIFKQRVKRYTFNHLTFT